MLFFSEFYIKNYQLSHGCCSDTGKYLRENLSRNFSRSDFTTKMEPCGKIDLLGSFLVTEQKKF